MSQFEEQPGAGDQTASDATQPFPAYGDEYADYVPTAAVATETAAEGDDQDYEDGGFERPSVGAKMTEFRTRIARALAGLERGELPHRHAEQGSWAVAADPEATEAFDVLADVPAEPDGARFPTGPFGYNRAAVDARIAELEAELAELRARRPVEHREPPISITEEIERLGEQTASILVTAHNQAHETARLAQEQADRCVADASTNAEAITAEAKRRLEALDMETDAVWQERARLLEDARRVGEKLVAMIAEAERRFPEELAPAEAGAKPDSV